MTTPLYQINTFPADDQAALREFNDRYIAALGAAPPPAWTDLGEMFPTSSPLVTFPISNLAIKYLERKADSRTKSLLAKSWDVRTVEYEAGYEAPLADLLEKIFAYRNWQQAPARLLLGEARHRNKQIAALLEDGQNQKWGSTGKEIDSANFFSATHLSDFNNPGSTTWGNYQAVAADCTDMAKLKAEVTAMQGVLDENGDKLGVDPDTILVPTEKYEPLKFALAQALMLDATGAAGVTNPYAGKFNIVHVPEFTDANDWYLVDSKLISAMGLPPWLSMRQTMPSPDLELRRWDTSSDYFKDTGNIKISSHLWYGFCLAFPHAIRKIVGA